MNREEYLRELETAGREVQWHGGAFYAAANPVNQLRREIAREWRWWLPGASIVGFLGARLLGRAASLHRLGAPEGDVSSAAAFWIPTVLKVLPGVLAQLVPLFLSLRSGRSR